MRILILIIVVLFFSPQCWAEKFRPFEGPKPIAVFTQSDPWAMVINSDTPRVAVYENGEVIFAKKIDNRLVYYHVILSKEELSEVQARIRSFLTLKDLQLHYYVSTATDHPWATFYFNDGQREVATMVYGLYDTGMPLKTQGLPKNVIPSAELLKLHEWLCHLDFPKSVVWQPKYVEVMFWDYSYAPDPSIQWPKEWPGFSSERALKRGIDYSIFLDGKLLQKLRVFLSTQNEMGAVELGGKKWAVAYRYTFPGEPIWKKAFGMGKKNSRQE